MFVLIVARTIQSLMSLTWFFISLVLMVTRTPSGIIQQGVRVLPLATLSISYENYTSVGIRMLQFKQMIAKKDQSHHDRATIVPIP